MRLRYPVRVAMILGLTTLCATNAASAASDPEGKTAVPRKLTLFRVSKEGLPTSHLFGTCHLGISLAQMLPREYYALLGGSTRFVGELDLRSLLDPTLIRDLMMLPNDETLSGMMGAVEWNELIEAYELGPAAEVLNRMHPFVLLGAALQNLSLSLSGGVPGIGVDQELNALVLSQSLSLGWLETPQDQVALMKSLSIEKWIETLDELRHPEGRREALEEVTRVIEFCRTGNESDLLAWMENQDVDDEAYEAWEARLLVDRNRAWVPKLEQFFAEGPTFAAVGGLHLYGEEGLIKLLQARGYSVYPLEGITDSSPKFPWSALIDQMVRQLGAIFCGEDKMFVQCTGISTSECRSRLTEAIRDCGKQQEVGARVSRESIAKVSNQIGLCAGKRIVAQTAAAPEEVKQSEGCRKAVGVLQNLAEPVQP